MSEEHVTDRNFLWPWVRATWAGWLLGVPLIIVLALLGEAAGIGGVQVLVGLGMGVGVGWMQGRAVQRLLNLSAKAWFWACAAGLGAPFLAWDVARLVGLNSDYSLYVCVALGGLIVGVWQASLLRARLHNPRWWIAASVVGWGLASGAAALADALTRSRVIPGLWGALAFLGIVAGGGLLLGLVTGLALALLLNQSAAGNNAA